MHHIEWDEHAGAAANARRELPALVTEYFTHVRGLLAKDPPASKLHRVRLATKRLRYTLELFRPCYGPGLEKRMAELRQVQQLLGEVNDGVAGERLLMKAMKPSPQRARVRKFLEERAGQTARKFRKHWTEVFDAPGRERWWTGYLRREARKPGRAKA
ncbi:hypothetical protein SBA4_450004 [Candidatus Sulfopaludibacter sp. SbA4]|nr:hypothetical protein SBA4_450004 [Candidatus Sulfopaludibacter sp. SbA4]